MTDLESDSSDFSQSLKIFEVIEWITDDIGNPNLLRNRISRETIKFFSKVLSDKFNLIALYGENAYCKAALEKYFNIENIKAIDMDEGIILYYSPDSQKAALFYYAKDIEIYHERPIPSSHKSASKIRILSNLAPFVLCFLSENDFAMWGNQSPFAQKRLENFDLQLAKMTIDESVLIGLGTVNVFTENYQDYFTHDSYKNILYSKIVKPDEQMRNKILGLWEHFSENVSAVGYIAKNVFINDFIQITDRIEFEMGTSKMNLDQFRKQLINVFRRYTANIKEEMISFFEEIRKQLLSNYNISEEIPRVNKEINDLQAKFLLLDSLEKSHISKLIKDSFTSAATITKSDIIINTWLKPQRNIRNRKIISIKKDFNQAMRNAFSPIEDYLNSFQLSIKIKLYHLAFPIRFTNVNSPSSL